MLLLISDYFCKEYWITFIYFSLVKKKTPNKYFEDIPYFKNLYL